MATYHRFAFLYDELMADAPYDQWLSFTLTHTMNHPIHQVVDLGCGTGEITYRLAKHFPEVIGIDKSETMLSIAEQKTFDKNLQVTYLKQDIRHVSGLTDVDLVVSYCDVINYLTTLADVRLVFKHVYDMLRDGGTFIFDVHSLTHVMDDLMNETFTFAGDNVAYIWNCLPGDEDGAMVHEMTFFAKSKRNESLYERFTEIHEQRTFSITTYRKLLTDVKFSDRKSTRLNSSHVAISYAV